MSVAYKASRQPNESIALEKEISSCMYATSREQDRVCSQAHVFNTVAAQAGAYTMRTGKRLARFHSARADSGTGREERGKCPRTLISLVIITSRGGWIHLLIGTSLVGDLSRRRGPASSVLRRENCGSRDIEAFVEGRNAAGCTTGQEESSFSVRGLERVTSEWTGERTKVQGTTRVARHIDRT